MKEKAFAVQHHQTAQFSQVQTPCAGDKNTLLAEFSGRSAKYGRKSNSAGGTIKWGQAKDVVWQPEDAWTKAIEHAIQTNISHRSLDIELTKARVDSERVGSAGEY